MDQNKTGLFAYLFKDVLLHPDDDMVLTCAYDIASITNANQMFSTFICTVDTDVLVLAVSVFARLKDQLEELWVDSELGNIESMFLSKLFPLTLLNQEHTDSHFPNHSLDATNFLFYPMLQREQFRRFGTYFTIIILFLKA